MVSPFQPKSVRFHYILVTGLFVLGLLMVQGCGFQLRGAQEIPVALNPAFIQASASSGVARELRRVFRASKVQLAATPDQAQGRIRILKERYRTRVLSVDGQGKVVEYALHLEIEFDVVDPQGQELLARQSLNMTRSHINPEVQVLGKQQEESLIRNDMQRDAAVRLLHRIRAGLAKN